MKNDFITKITIENVRGIEKAVFENLSDVNLILGGNNGGKTSFLEAIRLLDAKEAYDCVQIARERKKGFLNVADLQLLFARHKHELLVSAETTKGEAMETRASYSVQSTTFDKKVFSQQDEQTSLSQLFDSLIDNYHYDGKPMRQMNLKVLSNGELNAESFLDVDIPFGRVAKKKKGRRHIRYVNPSAHFAPSVDWIASMLRKDGYSEIVMKLMQLIEPNLEKIQILPDPLTNENEVLLKVRGEDAESLSTYGDGTKKALLLACTIADAKDGILLLDEVETSLHHSLYDNLFRFLVKASRQFGVQLFITTHSKEVIQCFYDATSSEPERLRVYTMRKGENGIAVRGLTAAEAQDYSGLGIEVRD